MWKRYSVNHYMIRNATSLGIIKRDSRWNFVMTDWGGEGSLYSTILLCTVLCCTVLYCTVLQVSLAPLDPLVTVVQPQAASCCALLNTAAGCEVGAE